MRGRHEELYFGMDSETVARLRQEAQRIAEDQRGNALVEVDVLMGLMQNVRAPGVAHIFNAPDSRPNMDPRAFAELMDLHRRELHIIVERVRTTARQHTEADIRAHYRELRARVRTVPEALARLNEDEGIILDAIGHRQQLMNINSLSCALGGSGLMHLTNEMASSRPSVCDTKQRLPMPGVVPLPFLPSLFNEDQATKSMPVAENPSRILGKDTSKIKNFEKIAGQIPNKSEEEKNTLLFGLYDELMDDATPIETKTRVVNQFVSRYVRDHAISRNFVKSTLKAYLPSNNTSQKPSALSMFKEKQKKLSEERSAKSTNTTDTNIENSVPSQIGQKK